MIHPGPLKFVQVTNSLGEVFSLWGDDIHFVSLDGVGFPPIRNILDRASLQQGATQFGSFVDARRMNLSLYLEGNDPIHTDYLRDRLIETFSPLFSPLTLTITREDGKIREIDCFLDGEMDFPSSTRVGSAQPVMVPLIAPDPIWRDPVIFAAPATKFGAFMIITVDTTGTTWFSIPTLDVTGPLTVEARIVFEPGTRRITLSDGIPDGETWRFILDPKNPTVTRLSDGENMFSGVFKGLDVDPFIGFDIESQVILSGRETQRRTPWTLENDIIFINFDDLGTNTNATVTWQKRYATL